MKNDSKQVLSEVGMYNQTFLKLRELIPEELKSEVVYETESRFLQENLRLQEQHLTINDIKNKRRIHITVQGALAFYIINKDKTEGGSSKIFTTTVYSGIVNLFEDNSRQQYKLEQYLKGFAYYISRGIKW